MLKLSDNRRFLAHGDGRPFFYLADTAWELFHRLSLAEAEEYLRRRAAQGFTVIQAVVLAEIDGLHTPNMQGHTPLLDDDPARPNEAYFRDVDAVVDIAERLGLYIGMLPTWGDKWNLKWGAGPEVFTPENARGYGQFLGRRYRDKPIIWITGGDRPIETDRHFAILRELASGLREGDGGAHLITFHPGGGHTSAEWLHAEPWLDFNMLQSGHGRDTGNYDRIAVDYARVPIKPCLDGEPGYEDHPVAFNPKNGFLDAYDVRKYAYWAVFAGAAGHTYGCHDVWQLWHGARAPINWPRRPWTEAIDLPGARQMQHLRRLVEARPFLERVPDQALIAGDAGSGPAHLQATRGDDGSYAFVYTALGQPFTLELGRLSGSTLRACWYDPRTGAWDDAGPFPRRGSRTFTPPSHGRGNDWVLVLDDAARGYPAGI